MTVYLYGPLPFIRTIPTQLLNPGIPVHRVHDEVFGPCLWLPDTA
ncbi:hypothetical protein [Streptomyces sp. NPDC001652]